MPSSVAGSVAARTDATRAVGDATVVVVNRPAPKNNKKQSPQDAIDEFWKKFYSTTPGKGMFKEDSNITRHVAEKQ